MSKAELFSADVILGLYPSEVAGEVVRRHVGKFLAEKLMSPSEERMWIGRDGSLDPDYLAMMERSVKYWRARDDQKAVKRFEAELLGAENIVELVKYSGRDKVEAPVIISASDPGTFYVDKDGVKKSVTFVSVPYLSNESGWQYRQFALPTKFIGLEEHFAILQKVGDIARSVTLLGHSIGELTSESLIAFPVILDSVAHSLDDLAQLLGYESWDVVEEMAQDQLRLAEDTNAKERREFMVEEFSKRIIAKISLKKRSQLQEEALVNAMSDTFALERGGVYVGWDTQQIAEEIRKTVKLALVVQEGELGDYVNGPSLSERELYSQLEELVAHRQWLRRQFATNNLAKEARATGCGGSGISLFGRDILATNWMGYQLGLPIEDWQGSRIQVSNEELATSVLTEEEPEGRFENGIYEPGTCVLCGKKRQKVWHKSNGGCGCCTTCEHKLAGVSD